MEGAGLQVVGAAMESLQCLTGLQRCVRTPLVLQDCLLKERPALGNVSWQFTAALCTVQSRRTNQNLLFFLWRHASLSETCGRCPWCRRPWLSMVYLCWCWTKICHSSSLRLLCFESDR